MSRFQFSIRFLLVATIAVAAAVAAVRYDGPLAVMTVPPACLTLLFATAAVVGVMRTAGKLRSFWIGNALLLLLFSAYAVERVFWFLVSLKRGQVDISSFEITEAYWPFWCAAPVNGLFAVFLDWLFSPRGDRGP